MAFTFSVPTRERASKKKLRNHFVHNALHNQCEYFPPDEQFKTDKSKAFVLFPNIEGSVDVVGGGKREERRHCTREGGAKKTKTFKSGD